MSDVGQAQANVISLNDLRPLFDRLLADARIAGPRQGLENFLAEGDAETLIQAFMHHPFETDHFDRQLQQALLDRAERMRAPWSLRSWRIEARRRNAAQRAMDRDQDRLLRQSTQRGRRGREDQQRQDRQQQRNDLPEDERLIAMPSLLLQCQGYLMRDFPRRIWWDEFYKVVMIDWQRTPSIPAGPRQLTNMDIKALQSHLSHYQDDGGGVSDPSDPRSEPMLGNVRVTTVHDAIELVADRDVRNEPLDWLKSLTWDNTPRLDTMFSRIFKAEDTPFNRAAARILLIGMVARLVRPGVKYDTIIVLQGGQGLLKSTALEVIGGKWYAQVTSSVDSKDFLQEQHGVWLLEMAELHSMVSSRHGAAKVKATLSSRKDRFRIPYGRLMEIYERASIMVGTSNDTGWHSDVTGARRIVPVFIGEEIDIEALKVEREQLFAEAYKLFLDGATWWEFPVKEHIVLIEMLRERSPFEEDLDLYLKLNHDTVHDGLNGTPPILHKALVPGEPREWGTLVTVDRVAHWLGLTTEVKGRDANQRAITKALYGLGFQAQLMRTHDDGRVRCWVRSKVKGLTAEEWQQWPPPSSQGDLPLGRRDPF